MNDSRINYTQVIWEITCLLQEAVSLEDALRTSLEEVVKAVDAEAGTVWFYNSSGDRRIYPSFWIGGADLTGLSLECGEGIAGTVVRDAKTTVVKDCQKDERWAGRFDKATGFVTRSMICVPLTNKYETVGCIQIINKNDGSLYTDDDVSLCENLAMLTAIAIDNKGLHLGFTEEKKAIITLREAKKLADSGDDGRAVLSDVSCEILDGEILVILGESGSGKSTLLNIIGGLDRLSGGKFIFDGKDYTDADDNTLTAYRRSSVGHIFSSPELIPTLSARENLAFVGELCKKPPNPDTILEQLGLLEYRDKYPSELSGSARQSLALARALMKRPRVILADEPAELLDYDSGIEVLSALEAAVSDGMTLVIATHNEEIAKMASRVIRMKRGTIADITVNHHPVSAKELVW